MFDTFQINQLALQLPCSELMLVEWLVVWLGCCLVGSWLVVWLDCCLSGRLVGSLVGFLLG